MPWKVNDIVNERMRFVLRREAGERMSDLCREFGISRKTGHKIWKRFLDWGPRGLYDQPRRPEHSPKRTSEEIRKLLVAARKERPTWGPVKLKEDLERQHGGVRFPAPSTIGELLSREGLVKRRRRSRRRATYSTQLRQSNGPNELWSADFKGEFRLKNRRYCYPLTISDHFSRYLLGCVGLESTHGHGAKMVFEEAFRLWGLPRAIRTDNGSPFASCGLLGLSRLSVWWLRLGIDVERIEPGHPEQNGRHERLHLTLKEEATRPAGANHLEQQEKLERFTQEYNDRRPHAALGLKRPAEVYQESDRKFPEELPEPEYPLHDQVRVVTNCGHLSLGGRRGKTIYLSSALAKQPVGLREEDDGKWLISFLHRDLGYWDEVSGEFERIE
jgi:transposase InsO family protein